MKQYLAMIGVACASVVMVVSGQQAALPTPAPQQDVPWAYPVNPPPAPGAGRGAAAAGAPPAAGAPSAGAPAAAPARGAAPDPTPLHLPGTDVALTQAQMRNLFDVPDWHPTDHPAMPDVVQHGRRPDVRACGYCHLPNGQGRPENAPIWGLPAGYFLQQMSDFKNGK